MEEPCYVVSDGQRRWAGWSLAHSASPYSARA